MKKIISIIVIMLASAITLMATAQQDSSVMIKSQLLDANMKPIIAAEVSFPESNIIVLTDVEGRFEVAVLNHMQACKIAYLSTDRIDTSFYVLPSSFPNSITLKGKSNTLETVTVVKRRKSSEISMLNTMNQTRIGTKELAKAACCNLSESFETTPSVDVGFTDAVTGYRQISMLGLSGPNVSFTRENIPDLRGLGAITGLTFTPGPWVEAIMLSKGTGSVVNGYDGVAGQINVELSKPSDVDGYRYLVNAYQSTQGRSELNLVKHDIFSQQTNNSFFAHYKRNWMRVDQNDDQYMDQPLGQTFAFTNRTMHISKQNIEYQLGLKGVFMDLNGGQVDFQKSQEMSINNPWGFSTGIKRGEVWGKIGKLYVHEPYRSMALQISGIFQDQQSHYGLRPYHAKQNTLYANYIYQDIIDNTNHKYKVGASMQYDDIYEHWAQYHIHRKEIVPGLYGEYTFNHQDKFNLVAGIRADYSNYYGAFVTPRLHIRYAPDEQTTFRASIGRAQRSVNLFSEHMGMMASNRIFEIIPDPNYANAPYSLAPEISWNVGGSAIRKFILGNRDGSISIDYYFTNFENMVVHDIEQYDKAIFYNLDGTAYAHSAQAQVDYELLRRFDIRIAYRWYDVKTTLMNKGILSTPLIANHRYFVNVAYETKNKWKIDATANWTGTKRMVDAQHGALPVITPGFQTPSYWTINGQVSKSHKKELWRVYLGFENILNDMQHHLIMNPQNPFSNGFDASLVWGNAMGRNIYLGVDFKIK